MVYACFFCRRRTCLRCLRPAPGMLPMCTLCTGERIRPALSPREAIWAQRMEDVVDRLMINILNLGSTMIEHETIMKENPRYSTGEGVLGMEDFIASLSPAERYLNKNTPQQMPEGIMGRHNASIPSVGRSAGSSTDLPTDVRPAEWSGLD